MGDLPHCDTGDDTADEKIHDVLSPSAESAAQGKELDGTDQLRATNENGT